MNWRHAGFHRAPRGLMVQQMARTRPDAGGGQIVEIAVRGRYRPAAIRARAGVPLRIVFLRDDDDECSERVVFSRPRLDRRLAERGQTMIDLPAQPVGETRFTCGMGRYRGQIHFVDAARPSLVARLRERVGRSHATAPLLWLCSVSLVAVLAVLLLDLRVALAVAGLGLLAWTAARAWALRGSATST